MDGNLAFYIAFKYCRCLPVAPMNQGHARRPPVHHKKRALPFGSARFRSALSNQYFRVSPFCSEKYVVRSCMSASDKACT